MSTQQSTPQPVRWPGLVKAVTSAQKVVDKVIAGICLVVFVALVAIVTWQVFTRQVLNNSAPWTEEAARYAFILLAMFAAAYVFSERGHIAVEMLLEKLPKGPQLWMSVLIEAIVAFFIGSSFVYGGWLLSQNAWNQHSATLPVTVGQVYSLMPIAGIIILFYCVVNVINLLAGVAKPVAHDEIEEAI
ncbi:TRAP transporter small permease [Propionibacteriaceae bacterium G1746]